MYAAGFLFMGATEEQMNLVAGSAMDHVSYILITYSLASIMFLFVNMLNLREHNLTHAPMLTVGI